MPELIKSPYQFEDKLSTLSEAKEEKLNNLAPELEYETVPLKSLYDVDSLGFEGVTGGLGGLNKEDGSRYDRTGQESLDRLNNIDSYEARPTSDYTLKYQTENPDGIKKMERQRNALAAERNVDPNTITNEDVYQEERKRYVKTLAVAQAYSQGDEEYIKEVLEWEPSEEFLNNFSANPPDIASLGIEVDRAFTGDYGYYGRPVSVVRPKGSKYLFGVEGGGYDYTNDVQYNTPKAFLSEEEIRASYQQIQAENASMWDRIADAPARFAKGVAKEVVYDFGDWVGESLNKITDGTVGWDFGTEEQKEANLNKLFGINPYAAEKEYKAAKQYATNIVDAVQDENKEVNFKDAYELVKLGITTPELLVDSASFIASMFVPILGWGGKAAKADKVVQSANSIINSTEKAFKAGKITKEAAKAAVKKQKKVIAEATADVSVLNQVSKFAQQNAGLMQISAGNVNDQIDKYKEEFGEDPSVGKVAQMMVTETLMLSIDRWADLSILKSPLALKGVREAFNVLPKEGKAKILGKTIGTAVGLAANMGKEAGQEYLQEIGQEFNVKFNFDDNTGEFLSAETLNEAKEVFLSRDMQITGVTGAGLGAGGAVQFAGIGSVGNIFSKGGGKVGEKILSKKDNNKNFSENIPTTSPEISEEDLVKATTQADKDASKTAYKYASMFSDAEGMAIYQSEDLADQEIIDTPTFDEALKNSSMKYADVINEIESAEVVIEDRQNTDRQQEGDDLSLRMLRKAKARASQKIMESEKPTVLGSGFSPEDVVETFLESKTTSDGKLEITTEEKSLVNNYLKQNGQKPFRFERIAAKIEGKDSYAVYDDSMGTGANSAPNRRNRLKRLLNTPGVDKKKVNEEVKGIKNFLNTQLERKQQFEAVYKQVEADIKRYNNAKTESAKAVKPKSVDFEIDGRKVFINPKKQSNGKYKIESSSKAILDSMNDTIDHLQTTLNRYRKATVKVTGSSQETKENEIVVPESTNVAKNIQESRKKHKKYYSKRNPTKVIVDKDNSPSWWKESGDYAILNESKISKANTTYSSDDVVLLTTTNIKSGTTASKTLKKAIQAGATIILDEPLVKEGQSKKVRTLAKSYGAGVVNVDGIVQWKPIKQAEEIRTEQATDAKAKRRKEAILKKVTNAYDAIFIANSEKRKYTSEERATLTNAIENAKEFYRKEGLSETEITENIKKSVKTRIANEAVELEKILKDIMLKEGTSSKAYSEAFGKYTKSAIRVADKKVKAEEKRLSLGGKLVKEWKEAEKVSRFEGDSLNEWVKALFGDTVKQKGVELLNNSLGKAKDPKKPIYSYKQKNKTTYTTTTYFKDVENFSVDGTYHVIEVDPEKYLEVKDITLFNTVGVEELKLDGSENALFNKFVEDSLERLKNTLDDVNLGRTVLPYDLIDSPAASLLYDKDKKLNGNAAVAVRVALYNFVRNNASLLSKDFKSEKDIAEILGKHESELSDEAILAMQDKGLLMKTAADSVGKDIVKLLGLGAKQDENIDAQMFNAITTELGSIALLMGMQKEEGLLKKQSMKSKEFASTVLGKKAIDTSGGEADVNFVNIVDDDVLESVIATVDKLSEILPGTDVRRKEPSFKKLTEKEKNKAVSKIKKDKLNVGIAEDSKKAMEELMDTEMVADMPLLRFATEEKNKLRIMKLLGWIDLDSEEFKKLSYKEQKTQASKNRDLERNFNHLEWLDKQIKPSKQKTSMWFKYFFSKNGRFFIDSNTVNPQTNKHLDRFFIQPKEHYNTFNVKRRFNTENSSKGVEHKFFVKGEDVTFNVQYALAQAFGLATDKKSNSTITKFSSTVLNRLTTKDKLNAAREEFLNTGKVVFYKEIITEGKKVIATDKDGNKIVEAEIKIEHLGHALQGFSFIEKMLTSPNSFESSLSAEFDAVTSGFALKLLQMPIIGEKLYEWLSKVGIVLKDNKLLSELDEEGISMNNMLDLKNITNDKVTFLDSYQFLANSIKNTSYETLRKNSEGSVLLKNEEGYSKDLWNAVSKVLPSVDGKGTISSELRNLFKYPFMTFNYASSIKSIRGRLKVNMQDDIAKQIASVDLDKKDHEKKEQNIINMLKTFANSDDIEILKKLQEDVRTKDIKYVKVDKGASLGNYLDVMIDSSYGIQVQEVLEKEFKPFVKAQDAVNSSFKAMFEIFKVSYEKELLKARQQGPVSVKKEKEIYERLKSKWPAIKGPLNNMEEEFSTEGSIGVYSLETASPYGMFAGRKAAQTKVSKELKEIVGSNTVTTSHMIKTISAAISAGSVIPIHYIDGAVMGKTINSMGGGMTSIHDAIMMNLMQIGKGQKIYNKEVIDVSTGYSFIDEIVKSLDKMINTTELFSDSEKTDYQKAKVVIDRKSTTNAASYLIASRNAMASIANEVNSARNSLFNKLNKGSLVMHMAGTKDGVYYIDKQNQIEYKSIPQYSTITDRSIEPKINGDTAASINNLAKKVCSL